ncbi:MAG: hypothetical protein ABSA92_01120 [Candidatus Bathyarchaeia archaeon]
MSQLEQRLAELRFVDGVEKAEHVQFSTGDQFWVRFNHPLDMQKLQRTARDHGCSVIKFGGILAKAPRGLSELLWDGVTHVIVKEISQWSKFIATLGFEPDGIGKVAIDLHGPYQIFMAMNEAGIQLLYDYLGVKYVPPPPKPVVAPVKPATTVAKSPATTSDPANKGESPPVATKALAAPAQTPPAEKATT